MRPYADRMLELMVGTARAGASVRGLPLLQRREEHTVAIVPLTGDRGLAGAFNAQILRRAFALERRAARARARTVRWLVAGKKGSSTLRFRGYELDQAWTGFTDRPAYADAQAIAHRLAELYVERGGRPGRRRLQPLRLAARPAGRSSRTCCRSRRRCSSARARRRARSALLGDFIYEPEPEEILARLLPVYLETEIYRALLESAASEQGARMTAMRNASKNAGELIDTLTLAMNRARQAEITQEILEVVAGADALTQ